LFQVAAHGQSNTFGIIPRCPVWHRGGELGELALRPQYCRHRIDGTQFNLFHRAELPQGGERIKAIIPVLSA
jgi:hypothetical protein